MYNPKKTSEKLIQLNMEKKKSFCYWILVIPEGKGELWYI